MDNKVELTAEELEYKNKLQFVRSMRFKQQINAFEKEILERFKRRDASTKVEEFMERHIEIEIAEICKMALSEAALMFEQDNTSPNSD